MNTSRLLEILKLLIRVEKEHNIQDGLTSLDSDLAQLVSQPSEAGYQTNFANSIEKLREKINSARSNFQPAQIKLLEEIGADEYFLSDMSSLIVNLLGENVATPAVAKQKLEQLIRDRQRYIEKITQLHDNLIDLGITINELEPGHAEIGFTLPRDLFDNEFRKLQGELKVIERIVRAFSEAATGSVEPIKVGQISTSDPQFFFGYDINVIKLIGKAFTWALDTWLIVEDIRKTRADTAKIKSFKEDDSILKLFDEKIIKTIEDATKNKVNELLKDVEDKNGRKNEQETDLRWALESIMSRVERGVTVEVRFLPPPIEKVNDDEEPAPLPPVYDELQEISRQLVFPKMEGEPILKLPPIKPEPGIENGDGKPKGNEKK